MARPPYAMVQLLNEVVTIAPHVEATASDLDGFGVYRTLKWDKRTADKIRQAVIVVGSRDERIEQVLSNGVVFTAGIHADNRDPFNLFEVQQILKPAKKQTKKK